MGIVALMGGDEFRPACVDMDRSLLSRVGRSRVRVAIIPIAATHSNPQLAAHNGVEYFSSLGADATAVMILNPTDANDQALVERVLLADLVYLTGGDPWYLLQSLVNTLLWNALRRFLEGVGVVVGSSAGAMVLGEVMRTRQPGSWMPATGLVERVALSPHHERRSGSSLAEVRSGLDEQIRLIGVDSATAAVRLADGLWEAIGAGTVVVYYQGEACLYRAGERFSLP